MIKRNITIWLQEPSLRLFEAAITDQEFFMINCSAVTTPYGQKINMKLKNMINLEENTPIPAEIQLAFPKMESEEENKFKAEMQEFNKKSWLGRLFSKKPKLQISETINCRCVCPKIDLD